MTTFSGTLYLEIQRQLTNPKTETTFGRLIMPGYWCHTLEDAVRQTGQPKVYSKTAIDAMEYDLGLKNSPKFGPDSIQILHVPQYDDVLIHSGVDKDSTLGCIIVGDRIDEEKGTISGGKARGVLDSVKAIIVPHLKAGGKVKLKIKDFGFYGPNART